MWNKVARGGEKVSSVRPKTRGPTPNVHQAFSHWARGLPAAWTHHPWDPTGKVGCCSPTQNLAELLGERQDAWRSKKMLTPTSKESTLMKMWVDRQCHVLLGSVFLLILNLNNERLGHFLGICMNAWGFFPLINLLLQILTSSINVQPWAIQLTKEAKDFIFALNI